MNDVSFILSELESISEPEYLKKMADLGIDISKAFGIRVPNIRKLGKQIGKIRSCLYCSGKPDFTKPVF